MADADFSPPTVSLTLREGDRWFARLRMHLDGDAPGETVAIDLTNSDVHVRAAVHDDVLFDLPVTTSVLGTAPVEETLFEWEVHGTTMRDGTWPCELRVLPNGVDLDAWTLLELLLYVEPRPQASTP